MNDTLQSYDDFIASKRLVDHDSGFGGELKRSYWEAAIRNLKAAENNGSQANLFD